MEISEKKIKKNLRHLKIPQAIILGFFSTVHISRKHILREFLWLPLRKLKQSFFWKFLRFLIGIAGEICNRITKGINDFQKKMEIIASGILNAFPKTA